MSMDFDHSAVLHKRSKRSEGILSIEDKRSDTTLSLIPRMKFRRALDIGCGLGVMLEKLSQISEEVVGLDISRILTVDGHFVVSLPNSYNIIDLFKIIRGKSIPELDFDAHGHHVFTSIEQNLNFIKREFDIIDLTYHYINHKYVSKFAKKFSYRSIINR